MKQSYICICGKEFKSQKSLSAHMASCKEHYLQRDGNLDNYYKRQKNLKQNVNNKNAIKVKRKKLNKQKEQKLEQWKSEKHKCACCGKLMTEVYGSGRFCSQSCANTRKPSQKTKEKISNTIKNNPEIKKSHFKLKLCKNCNKLFWGYARDKYCSKECQQNYNEYIKLKKNYTKLLKELYYKQCNFKFSINDYPDLFNIELLKKHGMYSAINRGNNINGVNRDHKYSKKNGFKNHIDPYYISHPCNCQLLLHQDNLNKRTKNSISFEELLNEINNFNNIYGEYPNIIDYTGFYFYIK